MKSIEKLQKSLPENNIIEIKLNNVFTIRYEFKWNKSAPDSEIQKATKDIKYNLPKDYIDFLKITNGAILYYDSKYGQWGYEFYPIKKIVKETIDLRKLGYEIPEHIFMFARCFGDSDMILIDTEKKAIIYGEGSLPYDKWEVIANSFEEFMDKLIESQGKKYWA